MGMETKMTRDELMRQIERVPPDTDSFAAYRPPEATGLKRKQEHQRIAAQAERESFGRWLLAQVDRGDAIDDLAKSARADPAFPKDGDPEAVRTRLRALMVDGDVFAVLDDAEMDWMSY